MIRKKETITIIVDDREVPSGVLGVIEEMEDVAAEVKRMPLGDYLIDGRLLVERKTIQDLAISMPGYQEVQGSGSRVKFYNGNADQMINLHKPHPGNIVKRYVLRQLLEKLVQGGLI